MGFAKKDPEERVERKVLLSVARRKA